MRFMNWATSLTLCGTALLHSDPAQATKFQMLKAGEWNIEIVESSLGPLAKAVKTKPFCIDSKTNSDNWESKAKEDLKKAGFDCNLKLLKDEVTSISYQTDCKVVEGAAQKNPVLGPGSQVNGQVTVTKVNDNEYTMDQTALAKGLNLPTMDLSKLPEGQRKLLEQTLGMKDGGMQLSSKQKYTYLSPTCSKKEKEGAKAK